MKRGRDSVGEIFEHEVALDHLCLILLVILKLLVKHSNKAVSVMQHEVSHFGLGVTEFGDDILDYLFVQFLLHPVFCGSGQQFLVRVVLGIVTVLYTNEVVDNVEIVVYHIATIHDVSAVECARTGILQCLGVT
jgi:hypothetical protein